MNGGKGAKVGMVMAKQKSSGAPKDGCFRDVSPVKENPQCPYSNPSKAEKKPMIVRGA